LTAAPAEESVCAENAAESVPSAENTTTYRIEFDCADLGKSVMEKLLADLARQGQLKNLSDADDETVCVLQLATTDSEEDIWEALAFLVDPASLVIRIDENVSSVAEVSAPAAED